MLRRQLSVFCACLLVAGGLVYGLVRLFALRTEGGDVYPPYSTLRADPLGAKALLDALNDIPGLSAWRNYLPLPRLHTSGPVALVYLGLSHEAKWEEKELPAFEALIAGGSRALFAFQPVPAVDPARDREAEEEKKRVEKKAKTEPQKQEKAVLEKLKAQEQARSFATVAQKWGFGFEVTRRAPKEKPPQFIAEAQPAAVGLEASLPWHSELHFTAVKAPWKTLYSLQGKPVLIERPWGAGSLVLASDSYFLSNEGLRETTRAPKLLAWLIGNQHHIIFDEEHLGISEQSGISTLARKYRLHGLVGGLLLVAALFVWQNIVRFVPPAEEALTAAVVSGRGSHEGFLTLLRRSVPTSELLNLCVAEWRRTFTGDARVLERVHEASPAEGRKQKAPEIVATYQAIARAINHPRVPPSS